MASTFLRAIGWTACVAAVVLLVAALVLAVRAQAGEVAVTGATVRLPAVTGRPAAGYVTIRAGDSDVIVAGATSPLATRIELHGTSMAGGVMRMYALPQLRIRAGSSGGFAPGREHLMIFGLRGDVKPGATVPIVLRLRDGKTIRVEALAVAAGAAMTDAHSEHGAH